MKFRIIVLLAVSALFGFAGNASAQDIVSDVQRGCGVEIEKYCSQVSMGEGRLLACFYAHEDKLSGQCEYTLYTAAAELEHAVSALNYVAGQCQDDIIAHCAERLAKFKLPQSVVFTDIIPRNATGKVLKTVLREKFGADQ